MGGRRTNVALGALLVVALLTGVLAFGFGTRVPAEAIAIAHGVVGLGVLLLAPWKSTIVRRGLRRRRKGWQASVLLAALVVITVASGVAHAAGAWVLPLGVTTIQVHVGAALGAAGLATWHALARPARPRRIDLRRRSLLRTAGWVGAAAAGWTATEGAWALADTGGADRRFTGSHERGSDDPAAMPVTQWLFDVVPAVQDWRLRVVDGEGERMLGLADIDRGEGVRAVLDCTGGWWARQEWTGVRLDHLVVPGPASRSVVVRSVTGYTRRFPVSDLTRLWLAARCAGQPLSVGHGAPVRLVAPGRRGFWWVKWVEAVELDDAPAWRQPPFPLQ